jgi:hypothetical protein
MVGFGGLGWSEVEVEVTNVAMDDGVRLTFGWPSTDWLADWQTSGLA